MGANMGATIGHQRGAGLIEVLVALLIISLGLMSMARLSATTIGFNKGAQVRLVALSLANQYAEHARLNVYGFDLGGYSRNISVINPLGSVSGEGSPFDQPCTPTDFLILGLGDNPLPGQITCKKPKPWSRQQYQLTRPPL